MSDYDEEQKREAAYEEWMFNKYMGIYSKHQIIRMSEVSIDWDEFLEEYEDE